MKPIVRKILSAILLLIFLGSTTMFVISFFDKEKGEASYQAAEALATQATQPATEAIEAPTEAPTEAATEPEPEWVVAPIPDDDPHYETISQTNLAALREVNPDVIGWISIPGTKINYPISQGEDNSYYLTHTWEGEPNYCGAIFLEHTNSTDFTDFNTIVYGHNMRNGSMFAGLHYYKSLAHWETHPYVYLVTDEGVLRYEIFSSYNAEVDSPTYGLGFRQPETREAYIQMAIDKSEIDTGCVPAHTDRILTLSTCTGLGYKERRVVHAYLPMELQ